MTSPGPWGALPQARAVANAIEGLGEELQQYRSRGDVDAEKVGNMESTSDKSDETDSSEREERHVLELARTFTYASVKNAEGQYINPFLGSEDPTLDPSSEKFSAKAWVKTLVSIASRDPERYPERTAGVSYRNLSCHGYGNATDYQKTFGNYPLEAAGIFNKLTGRGQTKIQILRNFDGLAKSGEMLVVLGRPGR
jgi:ATP-binding cassette, subfamily G (WHITE), member 2, PDR